MKRDRGKISGPGPSPEQESWHVPFRQPRKRRYDRRVLESVDEQQVRPAPEHEATVLRAALARWRWLFGQGQGESERRVRRQGKENMTNELELLDRITVRASVFGGKPIIRDMRIAVEHVLGMLSEGDTAETISAGVPGTGTRRHSSLSAIRVSFGCRLACV